MEIDTITSSKEIPISRRRICRESFPVGFSSFSKLSNWSLEGSSSNPFSSFSAPSNDTKFAEETHMHGRRFLDLNSEASLQSMDQCQINEPLDLDSCLVLGSKLERRTSLNNKTKKPNIIKGPWTLEEDRLLSELVEKHGVRNWCVIAQKLPRRLGKQCRERWYNHLKPDIKKDKWSEEEDERLIEAHKELGNRWSKIARRLSGRSENTIKNHWNATKRLLSRKRSNPNPNTLLQNYIKSVISSSLGNSSLASISSNGTMVNSIQREQIN